MFVIVSEQLLLFRLQVPGGTLPGHVRGRFCRRPSLHGRLLLRHREAPAPGEYWTSDESCYRKLGPLGHASICKKCGKDLWVTITANLKDYISLLSV